MARNEQNPDLNENEKPIEEKKVENDVKKQEEEYKGRDWGKMILGVVFIFLVVVVWYVIDLFVP
ncbi:MAG: hypothetical protein H7645_02700 [Candidatus Heimdallarchaeota archaeon]|nr:hypothetical protein [Candidatus Heimdallarchaeota archaeon]MCK4769225.1 hypothetical protein [Candidatus Heimdallarchaeota archaeon]